MLFGADGRMGAQIAALAAQYGFCVEHKSAAVAVDFSHPDALDTVLSAVLDRSMPLVCGTTGYSPAQQAQLAQAACRVPVFQSANFSLGAAVLARLAAIAAKETSQWDISLTEIHHAAKQDAPSGTALKLAQLLALPPERVLSVRGGTVTGEHTVAFYGPQEHLTITHCAESRAVFAHGALRAARWLMGRPAGLYGMGDMLKTP